MVMVNGMDNSVRGMWKFITAGLCHHATRAQGVIDTLSGRVELEFDARFMWVVVVLCGWGGAVVRAMLLHQLWSGVVQLSASRNAPSVACWSVLVSYMHQAQLRQIVAHLYNSIAMFVDSAPL